MTAVPTPKSSSDDDLIDFLDAALRAPELLKTFSEALEGRKSALVVFLHADELVIQYADLSAFSERRA